MPRLIFETGIVCLTIVVTCLWGNSLLYIGEKVIQHPPVLELEMEAEPEEESKEEQQLEEEPVQEVQEESQQQDMAQSQDEVMPPANAQERMAQTPSATPPVPVADVPPLPQVAPAASTNIPPAQTVPPPAILPRLQFGGIDGDAGSFEGDAVGGVAGGEGDAPQGQVGPRMFVNYVNQPDWNALANHPHLQPLLIRQVRNGLEVALIGPTGPQQIMSVQEFVEQHSKYRGRVFLEMALWKQRYGDWNFRHGSNWQLYVAIDDQLIRNWDLEIQANLQLDGLTILDTESISIDFRFPQRPSEPPQMHYAGATPRTLEPTQQDAAP
ncbi:MAG: hypothetical protein R3C18_04605 [Planctomycetaceae bacterium]